MIQKINFIKAIKIKNQKIKNQKSSNRVIHDLTDFLGMDHLKLGHIILNNSQTNVPKQHIQYLIAKLLLQNFQGVQELHTLRGISLYL